MLGVHPITTTPYHPQTDGLVERFSKTLKQMLRKHVTEEGRNWSEMLPFVLFAYREVPQSTTGFSPFELIYGRDVCGLLDVVKECWTQSEGKQDDITTYVTQLYQGLTDAKKMVQQNLKEAQYKQKIWYESVLVRSILNMVTKYWYCYQHARKNYYGNGKGHSKCWRRLER